MSGKIEVFDQFADRYDGWYDTNHWAFQSEVFALERLLPRRVGAVEIGVGTGRFAKAFKIPIGVDPSISMLKFAAVREIEVIRGVAEELPFRNESFNLVLMVTTLCFLNNPDRSFAEAYRILRPGGQLVIGFIDSLGPLGVKYQQSEVSGVFFKQAHFYSAEEVEEFLLNHSFDDLFFVQTLFGAPEELTQIDPVKNGFGKGSFVVARGIKY